MSISRRTPIGSIAAIGRNGVIAGVTGSIAMDLVWYRRYRAGGGDSTFPRWEFLSTPAGFDDAPAPAQVGRVLAARAHIHLADRYAGVANNVVHWATGVSWGVLASGLRQLPGVGSFKAGVLAGLTAWGTSYVVLPKLGVYKPITEYDAKTLWKDLSAHLVFGAVTGASGAVLARLSK